MMRSSFLALLLTFSAFASSPEYLVGDTVPAAAPRERDSPAIASDGEDFFVVWSDERAGERAVVGTRITRDGRVLDPLGLRIATARIGVHNPSVAWDGAAYLVAWTASDSSGNYHIQAARVAPDGGIVMEPRMITGYGMTQGSRAAASNGSVSVILYTGGAPASGWLAATVLDREGNTLYEQVLPSGGIVTGSSVAAGASRFIVAWTQWGPDGSGPGRILGIPLTETGLPMGAPTQLAEGVDLSIGTDGTRFAVAWLDDKGNGSVASRTFDENLAPVNDGSILLTGSFQAPSVLWTGDRYEVVTMREASPNGSRIVSVELDRDGNPRWPSRNRGDVSGAGSLQHLVAGTNGVDMLTVRAVTGPWERRTYTMLSQLYAGNADRSGEPVLLSWSGNAHVDPSIASGPSGYFAAWTEEDGVFATRIGRGGNSLDGRGIRLSGHRQSYVRAAFDGTSYVVAWRDQGFIGLRWIAPLTGATVAEAQWAVSGRPELALATLPDATVLVIATADAVRLVRVPHSTHIPDPVPLDVALLRAGHPAAAWNGTELLVTWNTLYSHPRVSPPLYVPIEVHAARVSAGLTLLDPAPLLIAASPDRFDDPLGPPSVASDGRDWLVVMSLFDSDSDREDVLARRVLRSGIVAGAAPVTIGSGSKPAVAWTGARYAVAWKTGNFYDHERELLMATVPRSGALVAANSSTVSSGTAESSPSIVSTGSGEAAVAYTKFSRLPEHASAERTFFRVMDVNPRGRVVRR